MTNKDESTLLVVKLKCLLAFNKLLLVVLQLPLSNSFFWITKLLKVQIRLLSFS